MSCHAAQRWHNINIKFENEFRVRLTRETYSSTDHVYIINIVQIKSCTNILFVFGWIGLSKKKAFGIRMNVWKMPETCYVGWLHSQDITWIVCLWYIMRSEGSIFIFWCDAKRNQYTRNVTNALDEGWVNVCVAVWVVLLLWWRIRSIRLDGLVGSWLFNDYCC